MIVFKEIKIVNGTTFIVFENEKKARVDIPIDSNVAKQFMVYFDKISPQIAEPVESPID